MCGLLHRISVDKLPLWLLHKQDIADALHLEAQGWILTKAGTADSRKSSGVVPLRVMAVTEAGWAALHRADCNLCAHSVLSTCDLCAAKLSGRP